MDVASMRQGYALLRLCDRYGDARVVAIGMALNALMIARPVRRDQPRLKRQASPCHDREHDG
jgi:hypothetical protein